MAGFAAILVVSLVCIAYGAYLFSGNERCYRFLCGGDSFLALDPSEVELRKSARWSAMAVWLIVVVIWCTLARSYVSLSQAFADACLVVSILAGVGLAVIVILQIRQYVKLLKKSHG